MALLASQNSGEDTSLTIGVNGKPLLIDYHELEIFHRGDSWFGCTVGFRAMQVAATTFAKTSPWSRENLYIVSGHPGSGVKDAIDLVTQCVSAKRFRLLDESASKACSRAMKFEWWLSNGSITVYIKLHDNIVPDAFYQLLDSLNTHNELATDRDRFKQYKQDLSCQLWHQSLDAAFNVAILPTPLRLGQHPHAGELHHA
jgi:hypothetical protein